MLTPLQHSIVRHEVARAVEPEGLMSVTDYAEALGITRKNYYDQLNKEQVKAAITEGIESASKTKDYFALVTRQIAIEHLRLMATDKTDKEVRPMDRLRALTELIKHTEFADSAEYRIPYLNLSDEELYDIAVQRKERLKLTDEEYLAFRKEIDEASK